MDAMHGYDPPEAGSSYPSVANTPEVIAITLEAAERYIGRKINEEEIALVLSKKAD